jgi:hypothetical protein
MADESEISVSFYLKGFDKKVWSNPTKTTSRIYIYKIEDNIKIECGYYDLNKQFYCPPDKRRKHADHNVVICGEKESKEGLTQLATVEYQSATHIIYYRTDEPMESQEKPKKGLTRRKEVPTPVVDEPVDEPVDVGENNSLNIKESDLAHIAKITQSDMKVSISYGNTVELKSRNRGLIQSQYPKFSLSVDFEGGNIAEKIEEAADAVVKMVEDKLTEIISDITG